MEKRIINKIDGKSGKHRGTICSSCDKEKIHENMNEGNVLGKTRVVLNKYRGGCKKLRNSGKYPQHTHMIHTGNVVELQHKYTIYNWKIHRKSIETYIK